VCLVGLMAGWVDALPREGLGFVAHYRGSEGTRVVFIARGCLGAGWFPLLFGVLGLVGVCCLRIA
jgi:hypothetical protein